MSNATFPHRQSAHCESGVTANLFRHAGVDLSEPMAFGIGAGIFFAYFPFFKVDGIPLSTFRVRPGLIFRRATGMLGATVRTRSFGDAAAAMDDLDGLLEKGIPVGLQVGIYWLPFMPRALRFHFNGHNLIAYGKEGDDYLISDPVLDEPVRCPSRALKKARFSRGPLAPKGRMYYLERVNGGADFPRAIIRGLRSAGRSMRAPFPLIGVRGIRFLARSMRAWPEKLGQKRAALYLGQVIRMQEEVGTGGAGFRYLYAAFLQEASRLLSCERLGALEKEMTALGDLWNTFAVEGARVCKGRASTTTTYGVLAGILEECAAGEEGLFSRLKAYRPEGNGQ